MTVRAAKTTTHPSHDDSAKSRLLKAGMELFAARGLDGVTIRDLADAASVNVAAVHYHFGGKVELYAVVIEEVFSPLKSLLEEQSQVIEVARRTQDPSMARRALRSCVQGLMARLFLDGQARWAGSFLARESVQPTEAIKRVLDCFVRPAWAAFLSVLELLRPDLRGTEELQFVASSIVGQCLYYRHARPIVLATFALADLDRDFIERATAHISAFSLAALGLPISER